MLGLNSGGQGGNETEQTVRAFIEQTLTTFPYAWDQMPNTMNQFAWPPSISPFPRQALVGCDRRVVYVNSEYDHSALRTAIETALDSC